MLLLQRLVGDIAKRGVGDQGLGREIQNISLISHDMKHTQVRDIFFWNNIMREIYEGRATCPRSILPMMGGICKELRLIDRS